MLIYKEEYRLKILRAMVIMGLPLILLTKPIGVVFAQDEESFVQRSMISRSDAVVLSIMYPGLGQMTSEQTYKGLSFFLAETVSLILTINAHENYETKKKVYNKDTIEFENLANRGNYIDAVRQFEDLKDRSNELDDLNTIRNTALILAGAVYVYNIVDAVFFTPSLSESRRADINNSKIVVNSTIIDRTPGILLSKSF